MEWKDFSLREKESRDILITKKMYCTITGDLITAHLLSQIIYWFLPGKTGQSKIRIFKDEKEWIAKKRTDWKNECFISPVQFDRSIKILKNLGLVETKIYKFNGEPTCHISLCKNKFLQIIEQYFKNAEEEQY